MLADAANPESEDEFSYEEDPRTALLAHLFTDGIPGLARHRSPREPGLLPPLPPPVETGPIFLRNPVIPMPRTYNHTTGYLHRLEDVAATFGVDLEDERGMKKAVEDPHDPVHHPSHYTSSGARCPGCGRGIECIDVAEGMGFNLGNVFKYCWRHDLKGDAIENLEKASWYLRREIERRRAMLD